MGIFTDCTVKHEILIHKLEHGGIRGVALDLFSSFLTNRFQYVSLHNSQSSKKLITYGQGWEKSIVIDIDILYFLFIECIGAFTFLNEYQIWPCLYFFLA